MKPRHRTQLGAVALGLLLLSLGGCARPIQPLQRAPERDNFRFYGLQRVVGVTGAEDLTLADTATGDVFISADDRRARRCGLPGPSGIYLYQLQDPLRPPRLLTRGFAGPLHPHGISYYPPYKPGGAGTLFVINHRPAQGSTPAENTVELFDWQGDSLTHRRTVRHPLLLHPNDLVGVGPQQFYFTNDHGSRSQLGYYMETLLRLPRAGVVYFDGASDSARPVLGRLRYANGINRSPDGRYLYVSTVFGGRILRCRIAADGSLQRERELRLHVGADNLELDAQGRLWVTCHTQLLRFLQHVRRPGARSPWAVYRLDFDAPLGRQVRRYFYHSGAELSGASVTAIWRGRFVTGSVFEPHILTGKLY